MPEAQLTLRGGYYNHALGQVANLVNKVILCIQGHAVMFVLVYAYPFMHHSAKFQTPPTAVDLL